MALWMSSHSACEPIKIGSGCDGASKIRESLAAHLKQRLSPLGGTFGESSPDDTVGWTTGGVVQGIPCLNQSLLTLLRFKASNLH